MAWCGCAARSPASRASTAPAIAYFVLKDEKAAIEAVIWKSTFPRLKFKPEQGLEVIATGRITTYPDKSKYQIVIEQIEPAGIGALMALLEQREEALAAEGLFEAARKLPLPYLPRIIGVVTSPTGAVIRDILHRLADRFPCHVLVWPVRVQGETCAAEVAAAIAGFNALLADGAGAAARSHHRRPRRRQPRRPLGLQRGDRCARGRRKHHPADLGGRPRDRLDHHRPRRRLACADADRSRRACRAGAERPSHRGDVSRLARGALPSPHARGESEPFPRSLARHVAEDRYPGAAAAALRWFGSKAWPRATIQCAGASERA